MSAERIVRLRAGRDNEQVQLQKYNIFRSRQGGKLVCAVEGDDDAPFYDTMFGKIDSTILFIPFVCNGKDRVLRLRNILARNVAGDSRLVRYFIDHDFDGLRAHTMEHPNGADLYVTPCYSIENLLVGKSVLEKMLRSEYRCNDEYADQDVTRLIALFDARMQEFITCMYEANRLLHSARTQGIMLGSIDKDIIKKYLHISLDAVTVNEQAAELHQLIGYTSAPDGAELAVSLPAFEALDPMRDWRGKFLFEFFRKFLVLLKEDRGTKKPQYFTQRASMSFAPGGDITRALASMIAVPQCLHQFVSRGFSA
jgi:Protein of unknown function (DUF4435)